LDFAVQFTNYRWPSSIKGSSLEFLHIW
jgi:hypothetical protein